MQVPLEITFRGMSHSDGLEELVRTQVDKIERVFDHIDSCRVAIEKPHAHQRQGSGFRVRIDITVPPGHEIAATRTSSEGDIHDNPYAIVRDAFSAARRQLVKLSDRQRGHVKKHPQQQVGAVVSKIIDDHGFLLTTDGREIYFHANAVLDPGFEQLRVGSGVGFTEEVGDDGPQASSVRILDRRGQDLPAHP